MSTGITSTIRLAIRTLPENFDRSRIVAVIETIEQELYEGGVYASATADSFTIEITVRTDQLLDTAKVLTELELI
jgi:2-keto-3-deoxy-6-phosphogluconate aldolase